MITIIVMPNHHKRYENGIEVSHDYVPRQIKLEYSEDGINVDITIFPTLTTKHAVLVKQTKDALYYKGGHTSTDALYEYVAHLRPDNTIGMFTLTRIDKGITIEYIEDLIMFTEKEQSVVLQCIWQLFKTSPSIEECEYVEKITQGWQSKENCKLHPILLHFIAADMTDQRYMNYKWIICAISEDPWESFNYVSSFPDEKKQYFKGLVLNIIDHYGDPNFKTRMAVTLFEHTDIAFDFRVVNPVYDDCDGTINYRLI